MENEFKDAPQTIGELKSDKTSRANAWSMRDVLIGLLRDIDNGKINTDACVIIYREAETVGAGTFTHFRVASPDVHTTLGLLRHCEWEMLSGYYLGKP